MPYDPPVTTWAAGDPVLETDMNRIEGNTAYLHNPPSEEHTFNEGADYTTSSTSFTDVDGTNLSLEITVDEATTLLIAFRGQITNGTSGAITYFDVTKDGTRLGGDDGLFATAANNSAGSAKPGQCWIAFIEVAAGTYTFNLQWKVSTGTTTLYAGAGTSTLDTHGQFIVRKC